MTIDETIIDEVLRSLLQKNVKLHFKNKVFKQGKFLLYKQNNYHLVFTLQNSKKGNIKFEVPIPYNIETWSDESTVYFDYRLIALAKKKDGLLNELQSIKTANKESKFYDSIMEIQVIPNETVPEMVKHTT